MKRSLLIVIVLIFSSFMCNAQGWEVAIGGGVSENAAPNGNIFYKADQMIPNYAAMVSLMRDLRYGFQLGLQAHVSELSNTSSQSYPSIYYSNIGGDGTKFVYSKVTTSLCLALNKTFTIGKSQVYLGGAFGFDVARNNHLHTTNQAYIAPDGGDGISYGGQVGYNIFFNNRLAFNIEGAMRYYTLNSEAHGPFAKDHDPTLNYSITAYTLTFGFRYRLFDYDPESIPRYDIESLHKRPRNW